jgi:hypothetical protein
MFLERLRNKRERNCVQIPLLDMGHRIDAWGGFDIGDACIINSKRA